jgi:hypothetical protein
MTVKVPDTYEFDSLKDTVTRLQRDLEHLHKVLTKLLEEMKCQDR